jgi:transforming growth factor-beta-induced protein
MKSPNQPGLTGPLRVLSAFTLATLLFAACEEDTGTTPPVGTDRPDATTTDTRPASKPDAAVADSTPAPLADIVATAESAGTFKTLVAALTAADLVSTLKGPGPFTVLAPTDAAFAKLPAGTVDDLLKPENKSKLQAVLTYHVLPGAVPSSEVVKLTSAKTVEGREVKISVTGGMVKVNDANVTAVDIRASNGIIHVIDSVLLPPEPAAAPKTIVGTAEAAGTFKTLVAAVKAADLVATLEGQGPFTVFAPTDEAFAKLPAGTVETLLKPENKAMLQTILKYHVVAGKVPSSEVVKLTTAKTVEGRSVTIAVDAGKVKVNNANVIAVDVQASNGVIHVIDAVLLPTP